MNRINHTLSPFQTAKPIDDTTKPSRINRRRKKRWRISDLIFISLVESGVKS